MEPFITEGSTNPFVGPHPIAYGQRIHGRDHEIADLRDMLIAHRIVLLYSPSGAGKSSLLEAGLRPKMEVSNFHVFPTVRVGLAVDIGLGNRYTLSAKLSLEEGVPRGEQLEPTELAAWDLDAYMKRVASYVEDKDRDLCLFVDQFEELFTLDPADQDEKRSFLAQLGVALRDRSMWALLAMREDYIAQLDPYRSLVPTRLDTRYRLDLLDPRAASLTVRQLAKDANVDFTKDAAEQLIDNLRAVQVRRGDAVSTELGPYVEPVVLQVVCRRLWERMAL